MAIFAGQIAAALATGNVVLAKPAEQTPLIASRAVSLFHQAGIPTSVLQLVPGLGETVGQALTAHPKIAGVCFTGSTEVAQIIHQQLAKTGDEEIMFIAETGGINAMIVDSTALMEQAVEDIVTGAFRSAGQRCSALRVVYVQQDVADRLVIMLKGAMDLLNVGNPSTLATDVGPIIDIEAAQKISSYISQCADQGRVMHQVDMAQQGNFLAPVLISIKAIGDLETEIFGPVLHFCTYQSDQLDDVIDDINRCGYGLTFGLHTRIDGRVQHIVNKVNVGNFYVNRNQIGAMVGCQPFGG